MTAAVPAVVDDWGHARFRRDMLHALRRGLVRQRLAGGDDARSDDHDARPALLDASDRAGEDWLLALVDSWAVVGEILAFYQGRIAAEAFLPTAREDASIRAIVESFGETLDPGIAASARISLMIEPGVDPADEVRVPKGTRLQTRPGPNQAAVVFETDRDLVARAEWNRVAVTQAPAPAATFDPYADAIMLAGANRSVGPGSIIHIRDASAPAERGWTRIVRSVADRVLSTGPTDTAVTLQPLGSPPHAVEIEAPVASRFAVRTVMFGANAPRWAALPQAQRARLAPMGGGVTLVAADGSVSSANAGLAAPLVGPLVSPVPGVLVAAGAAGLLRWAEGEWRAIGGGARTATVTALYAGGDRLLAGTVDGHVHVSADSGLSWDDISAPLTPVAARRWPFAPAPPSRLPVTAIRAIAEDGATVAATDLGVFRSLGDGAGWSALNRGLPGEKGVLAAPVHGLIALAEGKLLAGTATGVHILDGSSWRPAFDIADPVLDLAATAGGVVLARTATGVWRSIDRGESWSSAWPVAAPPPATLAAAGDVALAATAGGVFRSSDGGVSWTAPASDAPKADRLAAMRDGTFVLASRQFVVPNEWPGFAAAPGRIDLDIQVGEAVAGGIAILVAGAAMTPYRVTGVETVRRVDFGVDRLVTRLTVDGDAAALKGADLRNAEVLLVDMPLELAPDRDRAADTMVASQPRFARRDLGSLPLGREMVLTGERFPATPLVLAAEHVLPPALAAPPSTGAAVPPPLYLHGNVVGVTQQRSVVGEVIGSGRATTAHQSFALKTGPLTFIGSGDGVRGQAVLTVRVGGIAWREVPHLTDAGPTDRWYEVRTLGDGRGLIRFGDGTHGARLPTGTDNIVADYAVGVGGEAPAPGQIATPLQTPVRLHGASNAAAGDPGRPAETPGQARDAAPRRWRSAGILVSLRDYRDAVAAVPGVGGALVERVPTPRGPLLVVSVASAAGDVAASLEEAAANDAAIAAAVRAAILPRADDEHGVRVRPCIRQSVGLTLAVTPSALPTQEVRATIQARLAAAFSGGFAMQVTKGAVVAALRASDDGIGPLVEDIAVIGGKATGAARWDGAAWAVVPASMAWIAPPVFVERAP